MKTTHLILLALVLSLVAGGLLFLSHQMKNNRIARITTFETCALAGYQIEATYPETCQTPDGRTFENEEQRQELEAKQEKKCVIAGCSAQICVTQGEAEGIMTTCEYRAEYACYKTAVCEVQESGECGWTETEELNTCLANPPELE